MVKACLSTVSDAELIWELQQENAKLRNTLSYYANKQIYVRDRYSKAFVRLAEIDVDGGKKARKGLGWNDNNSN